MASARLLSKLVSASGSLSAGALARVRDGDRARGLEVVKPLMGLVVESICVHSTPPEETRRTVEAYIQQLVERYGTTRRAVDALGSGRRKHPSISTEKAHAWSQVMAVGQGMIEQTLKRHAALMAHITNWLGTHHEFESKLDEFERWLDAPLDNEPARSGAAGGGIGSGSASPMAGHSTGSHPPAPAAAPGAADVKKVVAPMSSPASPIRLEDDDDLDGEGVSHSDFDALATLEDSSEQAKIAGEGSRDLKFIRLSVLHDKHPGEDPADRVLTDEQRAAIERLKKEPDQYARAVGAVAARDFLQADNLIPYLDGRVEASLLLTLRGDRMYFEGRPDEALPVYRQARSKRDDVVTRLNVAVTLLRATRGSLEDNFKEAIGLLGDTALTLGEGTREWARVRSILGLAWSHTPTGHRDKNMNEAIRCFESAATALKRDTDPQWWAETQLHLGRAWLDLPTGDRATNVSNAVRHFEHAAQVWTHAKHPLYWATVANCMGTASERNPRGDRQHNLGEALKCYTAALECCAGQKNSTLWASLQNNTANVLMQTTQGDHRANVERAIECYSRALEVYTHQNRRMEWAATQNNLGNAFAHLPAEGEERQKNLRRAIASYRGALEVRTKSAVPHEWATTQNNLGVALSLLAPGNNDAPLHEAVACFQHALEIRTRAQYPVEWATTQMNLGRTYGRLLTGERTENLQESTAYYENALEVFTAEAHPHQHQLVAGRLKDIRQQLLDLGGGGGR
jgi:tetratricopeptide (TPR) repeat protein